MKNNQRQLQKSNTRTQIIDTAMELFATNGLTTTRTSDIAKSIGISHGTIFLHFSSRDILLDTVIEEFGMRITKRLHELVEESGSMEEVLKAHLKGIIEYESFYTRLILESRMLSESSRNSLIMIQSAVSFHIIQVAEKEMKAGKLRSMPFDMLFNTWLGLVHYYLINSDLFSPSGSVLEKYSDQLVAHYINLITA